MNKYYVGLDVGTNSVGWAVTDENYELKRLKGKHAWGSRIFSEANGKKERRGFRSTRRRMARRKYRIQLLNTIFAEEINKIDNTFFARLDNASYLFEDKKNKGLSRNLIFKSFKEEKDFYETYPTTWHLRKALIENDEKAFSDIRNVYFALHHIIKYRGNFLKDGTYSVSEFDPSTIERLNSYFKEKYYSANNSNELEIDFILKEDAQKIINILLDNKTNKIGKQKEIKSLFNIVDFSEFINMFAVIVTGGTFKLSKLDKTFDLEVDFNKASFEDNISELQQCLGEDFIIVSIAKEIFDYIALNRLLGKEKFLSNVMINIYEEHKNDLRELKNLIINIDQNKGYKEKNERVYYSVFKDKSLKNNYSAFVHKNTNNERAESEDFNKFIENILIGNSEYISDNFKESYDKLLLKAKNRTLLKTIALSSTSIIPHQLHLIELEAIIDNCKKHFPFVFENKEKLIALFKFRVPYYYGPLDSRSEFSNVIRNKNETITPWNIDEIIDDNKTREKFMNRLTNTCSYLITEKVMPKVSLTFEKYLILERLNVMLVNGLPLNSTEKEETLNYLLSRSKTTIDQLKTQLSIIKNVPKNEILISKIKVDIPFEASSHAHLLKKFDISNEEKFEYFIFLATVYADDKKSFKEMLIREYPELTEDEVKHLLTLPTKKWAPISYKLLNGIMYTDELGIVHSILDIMMETNENFQMVLNNTKYGFLEKIKEINESYKEGNSIDDTVKKMLDSVPSITRRSINQTLLILEDVIKASNGVIPTKIFVESTRNDDDNKKGKETDSREKEISIFLNALDNDIQKNNLLKELELHKGKLKGKHIYLYFKQMGIDLYTGLPIDLNDVLNSTKYDLDHIIPQSLIKDDSLDNLVLVDKDYNQKIKKDYYPIPTAIRNEKMISLWKYLKEIKAISEKKYNNLIRSSEITLTEIEDFVARQINVVDYSNIAIRNILNIKYPTAKVVFSKSQYPHYIREKLNIVKNRNVNDTHHAVDAYLNVVAGNILSTEFSNVRYIYEQKRKDSTSKTFNMQNTLDRYLSQNVDGVQLKDRVVKNCLRRDVLVTFKNDFEFGAFYKQTIFNHNESDALIPIHTKQENPMSDASKYGGYMSLKQSYLMAVEFKEKGKHKKYILRVPTMFDKVYKDNQEELIKKVVGKPVEDIKLIAKIYQNQKIKYGGCEYLIYTNNENQNKYKMAYQNYVDNDTLYYLDKANKNIDKLAIQEDTIEIIKNRKEEKFVISKKTNCNIFEKLVNTAKKDVYETCNYIVKARDTDKEVFMTLSLKEQIETLNNFVKMFSRDCESVKFDTRLSNMPKNIKLLLSNNISQSHIIIYESPTGLYRHEVEI